MNPTRLDHVQLTVPPGTEQEAREFYTAVLGFEEIPRPESLREYGGMWLGAGDIELHLGIEDIDSEPSKRHPAFEVDDIDHARAMLEERDVTLFEEPPIPGRDRFSFRDPFGNRIELLERHE
ncbi:Catechol 2,3-dioxygenase [Halogranum gelatinilyticum]|uniref:Catechol 2,3-dioxygenase n=1 Tax=Halogranum gelatinilyticum TaxID=660521 RepID=A0A1G9P1I7_9EURY|nr:VOC family protein [Halogranum gelatinilyticum]SDL92481.1 Catechol 2,3-dioxygenase [Halogranum gelatinilyticum]